MLRATVEINLENAAFFDDDNVFDPGPEIARILRNLATEIEQEQPRDGVIIWGTILRDANGNDTGMFEMDCAIPEQS